MATAKVSRGNQPTASPPPRARLAVSIPPGFSRRESAENASSNPFWITIERPNVTSTAGRMPRSSSRLSTSRCNPYPTAAITGTTTTRASRGLRSSACTTTTAMKAARMLKSP